MYGLEMIVEPHRETTLTVKESTSASLGDNSGRDDTALFHWLLVRAYDTHGHSATAAALDGIEPELDFIGGSEITVMLVDPGTVYLLEVEEVNADGAKTAEGTRLKGKAKVSCKYVRRELRDLTDADRTDFFDALEEFYTVPNDEGKEKYGHEFFNYQRVTAYHNSMVSVARLGHVRRAVSVEFHGGHIF